MFETITQAGISVFFIGIFTGYIVASFIKKRRYHSKVDHLNQVITDREEWIKYLEEKHPRDTSAARIIS